MTETPEKTEVESPVAGEPPAMVEFVTDVRSHLDADFKAACWRQGLTTHDAIVVLMACVCYGTITFSSRTE